VPGGRWKVVVNNDRERYLQRHSSETFGYLFFICSTMGHLFMSLFRCAFTSTFSVARLSEQFFVGWVNVSRT
jgi:hypothetical protein